jgi:hypothetical protein
VDCQVPEIVLAAAKARLELVRDQEKEREGRKITTLSIVGAEILKQWKPGVTKSPAATRLATCPHCGREVGTYATGKLRVHGSPGNRCPEAWVKVVKKKQETAPFRFPMNREQYYAARDLIHFNGQSVASVLTQRLAEFARKGQI